MKRPKKIVSLILATLSLFTLTGCNNFLDDIISTVRQPSSSISSTIIEKRITDIVLNVSNLEMKIGDTYQLNATISPIDADDSVIWSSSDPDVASVDQNGFVTALKDGVAEISVSSTSGSFVSKCLISIASVPLESIEFNTTDYELDIGSTYSLSVTYFPSNASNKTLIWESSDENVVLVDTEGNITTAQNARPYDEAIVTAKSISSEKISAVCYISITSKEVINYYKVEPGFIYSDYDKHNVYELSSCPSVGGARLLVIPVWFTDSSNTGLSLQNRETVREDIRKCYFGTNEETGWRSVKTYYEEESILDDEMTLILDGTVSEWYECNLPSSRFYTDNQATSNLVDQAVNWYFKNNPDDLRVDYDFDGDGFLDGVMLIYAYPDYSADNSNHSNLWAYTYWVQKNQPNRLLPSVNVFFWASYDFMYGNNTRVGRYSSGSTGHCKLDTHTFIHEMGHVFGLEDYYDYSGQFSPAGAFSMQDYNIGGHDPYSVFALGWSNPFVAVGDCTIKIKPFQKSHELILLTPQWNKWNSPFDEYFLLEYYTPDGLNEFDMLHAYKNYYPTGPNDYGIRLWHIDSRLVSWNKTDSFYQPIFDVSMLTSNVTAYRNGVTLAFSNTYYRSKNDSSYSYISSLGTNYANYNILQYIRNNAADTYRPTSSFSSNSLFKKGSTFKMANFSRQFVNGTKMNNGEDLGFEFVVEDIAYNYATIKIISNK